MKFSIKNLAFVAVAATAATLASCSEDDSIQVPNRDPTLTVTNPDGSMSGASIRRANLDPNTAVEFKLVASDADGNIDRFIVERNDILVGIPASDVSLTIDGNVTPLPANPLLILNAEQNGFTKTIRLRSAGAFGDSVKYTFTVRDAEARDAEVNITLVNSVPPTPLQAEIKNVEFYNRAATAARPGAMDLDLGQFRRSDGDTLSEIQDLGNNSDGTWKKTWVAENNTTLRKAPANADYNSLTTEKQLIALYDEAKTDLTASDVIKKGDVYLAKKENRNKYYVILVNDVVDLALNESDKYVISIKQN